MPYGLTRIPPAGPGTPSPTIVPVTAAGMPPAAPNLVERHAGPQFWFHRTLAPTDFGTDGTALLNFSRNTPPSLVVVLAGIGDALYMALNGAASAEPGGYDLVHSGGGWLTMPVPEPDTLGLVTATGTAPGSRVEVWAFAGSYALMA